MNKPPRESSAASTAAADRVTKATPAGPSRRLSMLQRHVGATGGTASVAVSTSAQVVEELATERRRASFPTREMTLYLDGSPQRTEYREQAMAMLAAHPEFAVSYDLSRPEQRHVTLRKVRRLYELFLAHGGNVELRNALAEMVGVLDLPLWVRNGVHFGLFMGAILGQGDPAQMDQWLVPLMTLQVFGSFAMTELGHGSHARGLETTATFDPATDEFVLHTPTDTATKWWIGAAGETATHTVCFAQLLIDGEPKGLQSFVVPLRDPGTLRPLPGIRLGDCGAKMGLDGVDNGWIQFDHVRVPRDNMLRRYASVSRSGEFTQHHKAQLAYSALIGTRGKLVTLSTGILKKALTIAIRYCAVRRQGDQVVPGASHPETKLLDYQSHQFRLMPLLAKAYAYHFQTSHIERLIERFEADGGDIDVAELADIHGTMAGFKAFCTWDILGALEECRQSCGGMGYSAYSALGKTLTDFSVIVTFEGDNTVMAQQTGSYVLKALDALRSGQPLAGSVRYLLDGTADVGGRPHHWAVDNEGGVLALPQLRAAVRFWAARQVLDLGEIWTAAQRANPTRDAAWNACQVEIIDAARVHVFYNVAVGFLDQIERLRGATTAASGKPLLPVLEALCRLFILHELDRTGCAIFLRHGFMRPEHPRWVRAQMLACCRRVRADAVALVDAFNLRDHILGSTIGRADGDVYQHILTVATATDGHRAPYADSDIRPMLEGQGLD